MTDLPLLASVTLAGGWRESVIPGAINSVLPFVDAAILVDTGASAQASIEVIRQIVPGDKLLVVKSRLQDAEHCCTEARNDGMAYAAGLGFQWIIWCDTDERIHLRGFDLRSHLQATTANTLQMFNRDLTYTKERCIRMPPASCYASGAGPDMDMHEAYEGAGVAREILPTSVRFSELPKSPSEELLGFSETEKRARNWLASDPTALRPRYYLANSLTRFGRFEEAIYHYAEYAERTPHDDEFGWASFRIASCYGWIADRDAAASPAEYAVWLRGKAKEWCLKGLGRCPTMPELTWWLAVQEVKLGNIVQASYWTDMCISAGHSSGAKSLRKHRTGFQMPGASHESPWELKRDIMRFLGQDTEAVLCQERADAAIKSRVEGWQDI